MSDEAAGSTTVARLTFRFRFDQFDNVGLTLSQSLPDARKMHKTRLPVDHDVLVAKTVLKHFESVQKRVQKKRTKMCTYQSRRTMYMGAENALVPHERATHLGLRQNDGLIKTSFVEKEVKTEKLTEATGVSGGSLLGRDTHRVSVAFSESGVVCSSIAVTKDCRLT